jgi:prevent-host-death family protein
MAEASTYNVHDAKTHLSELLGRVERGEQIIIARAGRPVARLEAYAPTRLTIGFLDVDTPDDFFEPMSEEELGDWE